MISRDEFLKINAGDIILLASADDIELNEDDETPSGMYIDFDEYDGVLGTEVEVLCVEEGSCDGHYVAIAYNSDWCDDVLYVDEYLIEKVITHREYPQFDQFFA